MFRSLKPKVLALTLGAVVATSGATMLLTRRELMRGILDAEVAAARSVLDLLELHLRERYGDMRRDSQASLELRKERLRIVVSFGLAVLEEHHRLAESGRLSTAAAQASALRTIQSYRFANGDYLFVYDGAGVALANADTSLLGRNLLDYRDEKGHTVVRDLMDASRQPDGGYTDYVWRRVGESTAVPKIGYAMRYQPWGWMVGSGLYLDDIEREEKRRLAELLDQLRGTLSGTRIGKTGYLFLFDGSRRMLIHPTLAGRELSGLNDPGTGRPLVGELMEAARRPDRSLDYLWDRPDDPARFRYAKRSHVRYFKPLDWYVASSFYLDELSLPARALATRLALLVGLLVLASLAAAYLVIDRVTTPLARLTETSDGLVASGFSLPPDVEAELAALPAAHRDEVGRLAASFLSLSRTLRTYVAKLEEHGRTLERRVAERTGELSHKNSELEEALARLERTREQLVFQEKMASLGSLTAGIAHEIKNPLNFVVNFAVLSRRLLGGVREDLRSAVESLPDDARERVSEDLGDLDANLARIHEHGLRADAIVRGMLMHSRGKAGQRQRVDLNALVKEHTELAFHGLKAQDASFSVSVETHLDPSVGMLEVVPQELGRVFLNLVGNACYAAREKARRLGAGFAPGVVVSTQRDGGAVEVRVRDNGDGIPTAVRGQMFTPFFTTKPPGQGTGLGLSMSYEIVKQHGGDLLVESREGEFAELVMRLPG